MTDKQLPDWAIAKAFRQCQVFAAPSKTREFILLVEHRARELSAQKRPQRVRHSCEVDMLSECPGCEAEAQQPDAARGEHCPKCNFTMSGVGHCVNCAEQPARDGALLDEIGRKAWTVELEDGGTAYAVYMSDVRAIFDTQLPQPADGEAAFREQLSTVIRNLAEIVNAPQTDEQCEKELLPRPYVMERVVRIREAWDQIRRLRPTRGVEVTEEIVEVANNAYWKFLEEMDAGTDEDGHAMRAALQAALSGVQR